MVKDFNIRRLPASFRYAWRGIWHVLRSEQNAQIHLVATVAVLGLGLWLHISTVEFAILLLAIGLVISSEVLNTIIEDFLDVVHPEHHPAVRRIKDALAGAVLLSVMVAAAIGILLFLPHLLAAWF